PGAPASAPRCLAPPLRYTNGGFVSGSFRAVIQRRQHRVLAVLPPQRVQDEIVRQPRVLWQQAPVQIRPQEVLVASTLVPVLGIVPGAPQDPPQRRLSRREIRPPAVILEPHDLAV